ncbi:MAG: TIR domain-containing protein [Byssovorax sp.]
MSTPIHLFFSYAAEDESLRIELEAQLANLKRQGRIVGFDRRMIGAGQEVNAVLGERFEQAQVILLLISPDFMASDYCNDVEVKRAMERHERGEARVVPVLVRPCDWVGAPFAKLRALPRSGKAVTSWDDRDEAWVDVVVGIRAAIEEVQWTQEKSPFEAHDERPPPTLSPGDQASARFQEEQRAPALRIPSNPYDPWNPAVPPLFSGRFSLLRDLTVAFGEMRSVSLVGHWRIGKSSLLRRCERWAQESGRVVRWVSGEEGSGQSPGAFVQAITGLDTPADADGAADVLGRWAEAQGLPNLPPLVLVDEVDGMIARFDVRFFERIRGLLGHHRLILVLASSKDLDDLYKDVSKTSPFFNIVERQQVGLLEPEAVEAMIGWGRAIFGEKGADMLRQWAGRHPFYLQLLGGYLAQAILRGDSPHGALERFQDEAESRVKALWRSLEERDRQAIKESVKGGIAATRRSLRKRGLVTEGGKPFGEVLAAWVREEA